MRFGLDFQRRMRRKVKRRKRAMLKRKIIVPIVVRPGKVFGEEERRMEIPPVDWVQVNQEKVKWLVSQGRKAVR